MRGVFTILLILFAFALGYYYMTTYSTPLFIREINTITITTTTTIEPSPRIYVSKLYPYLRYQYPSGYEDAPSTEGWIWYQIGLDKPPEGYKYFILTNLSKNNFNSYVWGCDMCSWSEEGECRPVDFIELNSTHSYTFTNYDFRYGLYIELVYEPQEWDAVSNAYLVIVVVQENATVDQILSNLYIA